MKDLKKRFLDINNVVTLIHDYSSDEALVRKNIPRINLRKVKLTKQPLLEETLSDNLIKIDFPVFREVKDQEVEKLNIKPLRRKKEVDEPPKQIKLDQEDAEEKAEDKIDISEELPEPKPEKEELFQVEISQIDITEISQGADALNLIWPPKVKEEKKISKEKPYFIREEKQEAEKHEAKKQDVVEKAEKPQAKEKPFPWISQGDEYMGLESVFSSGLESELVGMPQEEKPTELLPSLFSESKEDIELEMLYQKKKEEEPISATLFKAFKPQVNTDNVSSSKEPLTIAVEKPVTTELEEKKINVKKSFLRKAGYMLDKLKGIKISPLRVVIWGGLACTICYLLISRYMPGSFNYLVQDEAGDTVANVFDRQKHMLKRDLRKQLLEEGSIQEEDHGQFAPISEKQRETLIENARQALQGGADPFGLESFLPPVQPEVSKKEDKSTEPQEISVERQQLELVGIIGAQNKNLALVNVYNALYTVLPTDDNEMRTNKLKLALSKAVPNRYEVSVLDPIEDWYVKSISKGKARTDDPVIELVKGDKKFNVKVGQKVLLPEEKPLPEPIIEELEE